MITLTGNILTIFNPFPTQNAANPPSAYRCVTARPIARALPAVVEATRSVVPVEFADDACCLRLFTNSGWLVMRKTLRRSNGAVAVLDTISALV